MSKAAVAPFTLLMLPLLVSGCTMAADAPSLAPRAVERFSAAEPEPPAPPPVAIPEDASRQERAAAIATQAREADTLFRQRLAEIQGMVASGAGAAPGSEAWVQAQQAVSRLDILREPVGRSLADLSALQIAAADTGMGSETEAALSAALTEVSGIDAEESRSIASLKDRLSNP